MVVRFLGFESFLRVGFAGLFSSRVDIAMKVMGPLSLSKVRNRDREIKSSDPHIMHKFSCIKTIEFSQLQVNEVGWKQEIQKKKTKQKIKKGQDWLNHVTASL